MKIAVKPLLKSQLYTSSMSLHYLAKYKIFNQFKIRTVRSQSRQWQIIHTHTLAVVDKLARSQEDQLQTFRSTCQILSAVVRIIFSPQHWLEEEIPAEDLTEVMRSAKLRCSKKSLNDDIVIS